MNFSHSFSHKTAPNDYTPTVSFQKLLSQPFEHNTTQHTTLSFPPFFFFSGSQNKAAALFFGLFSRKKKKKGNTSNKKIIYFSLFVESFLFHNNNWGNCWEFPVFSHPPCWPSILVSKKIAIRNQQQFFSCENLIFTGPVTVAVDPS